MSREQLPWNTKYERLIKAAEEGKVGPNGSGGTYQWLLAQVQWRDVTVETLRERQKLIESFLTKYFPEKEVGQGKENFEIEKVFSFAEETGRIPKLGNDKDENRLYYCMNNFINTHKTKPNPEKEETYRKLVGLIVKQRYGI